MTFLFQAENLAYGDLLQGSFVDSYDNMTLKTLNILTWYIKKCDRIPFLLKADDDMYINTNNLYNFASKFDDVGIAGFMHKNAKPFRDPNHKYYVPEQLYSGYVYPDFVSGTCYLVSRNNIFNKLMQKWDNFKLRQTAKLIKGSAKEWTLGCINSPPPRGQTVRRRDSRNPGTTP